ncbi:hypothetical protein [Coleofasciculus sp. G2-EDA-02]
MYLSESELLAAGYELNRFDGEHTIAFKFAGIGDLRSRLLYVSP